MLLLVLAALTGCSASFREHPQVVVLVPGAGGNSGYGGLRAGLREAGIEVPIETVGWGAPRPLFFMNLQDRGIHEGAERKLAKYLRHWRTENPEGQIVLIGHSAGCGVILGALAHEDAAVDRVVLLAPSVSPGYDLAAALRHVNVDLHVFHSNRDNLWLRWRTGTFGTYDNVRTPAAGHGGFTSVTHLPAELRAKVIQHSYDPAWAELGNDGSHDGPLAREFAQRVLARVVVD